MDSVFVFTIDKKYWCLLSIQTIKMPNCAVATCKNSNRKTKGRNVKYFGFPKNKDLAKQWVVACKRNDKINLENATVCSIHFEEKFIEIPLRNRLLEYLPKTVRHLRADAVPTLNLPGGPQKTDEKRTLRATKRRIHKEAEEIMHSVASISEITEEVESPVEEVEYGEVPENVVEVEYVDEQELIMELDERDKLLPQQSTETENEVIQLKKRIQELEIQNKELLETNNKQNVTIKKYEDAMAKIFTRGQIRKLLTPGLVTRVQWSQEDISAAISLHRVSPQAYQYLQANNYPLPAMSTLRKVSNKKNKCK